MSDWPTVKENDDGIRPAGRPDRCFYCGRLIGQLHERDCVTIKKRVRVRYTFEIEVDIPHSWDADDFERHRNASSWCADNAFAQIEQYVGDDCACGCFGAQFVEVVDDTPQQELRS